MLNCYYKDTIDSFQKRTIEEIVGLISMSNQFDTTTNQNKAWEQEIVILKSSLDNLSGSIFFEFSIPRMGKRIDCVIIIKNIVFVIEFKIGETQYFSQNIDQVYDYALDLKNFHKPSHTAILAPILVATDAKETFSNIEQPSHNDGVICPIRSNSASLRNAIEMTLKRFGSNIVIDGDEFIEGVYSPTPSIIEAAVSLYNSHSVEEITRNDAEAVNLTKTCDVITSIIEKAKSKKEKIICFVTGVPGAGKTLVGLKVATLHLAKEHGNASVYLSGNAPLVSILQEALARDKVRREKENGTKLSKLRAKEGVKAFIQIIHHYRDAYIVDTKAPYDHVAIFDEAQRAWDKNQTVKFMRQKKNQRDFNYSEPEFLISCLDRHKDWAVIICLVGGGQEINTGEAGISEWLNAISHKFTDWKVHISPNLTDSEYLAEDSIKKLQAENNICFEKDLHLSISLRSFRAEKVSHFVKALLDMRVADAKMIFSTISQKYPILLTRDLSKAKMWLKEQARGSERYGIVVSSQAQRLKPLAIDVKSPMNPVNWFLADKDDVRSSYYLEDVATEFHIQGLELDWVCVTWDGDLRYSKNGWKTFSFVGNKWHNINKESRQKYLINAYRVLLTRARQGMIIVLPFGSKDDPTRKPEFYDHTFDYLCELGISQV